MRYVDGARWTKRARSVAAAEVRPIARILFTSEDSDVLGAGEGRPRPAGEKLAESGVRISDTALSLGMNESRVCIALHSAHRLLRRGWVEDVPWCDAEGRYPTDTPTHFSLQGAVRSGVDDPLAADYALRLLRKVIGEGDLHRWAKNPVRKHSEVLRAVELAIEAAGGRAPRRGGWQISGSLRAPVQASARKAVRR